MRLLCKTCGFEENNSLHKDGYDLVHYICGKCRQNKRGQMISRVSNHIRVTLQNGDFYYVRKVYKQSPLAHVVK